ncbi:MAG: DUF2244 domain-containing protein [Alphaproteobacteria bacterium]
MRADETQNTRSAGRIFFDAVLHPYRSLSRSGFRLLMAAAACMMLSVGFLFALLGAWPVIGFCGVEFLLLFAMFRLNYRSARGYERVRLSDTSFDVQKIDPRGSEKNWRFEPTWLQVHMDNPPEHHSQLTIASHGRRLTIGKFLTPDERLEVASALRDALHLRRTTPPSGAPT